jgi:aerobic carbon-monoxide dehydrogenase large subunit
VAVTKMFGASVKRREDARMMTGRASYTDDVRLVNTAHMSIVRSPYAHARIKSIDIEKAREMPGVIAIYTGHDFTEDLAPVPCAWLIPDCDLRIPVYTALATDKVRYVGDEVAVVVAENRYQAQDAAAEVRVEYEPLPVVTNQEAAVKDGAPLLYDDVPNNRAFSWKIGGGEAKYLPVQARVGDYAIFFRRAAVEITFEGTKYLVVPLAAILVLVRERPEEPSW